MTAAAPLLEVRGISKSFAGIRVLDNICFDLGQGEVHALLGENGAGKSTLMNILSGVLRPDSGTIFWEGRPLRLHSPNDAHRVGISFVHQELALVPQLSVAENIFLGRPLSRYGFFRFDEMRDRATTVLRKLGCDIDPRRPVGELSLMERQLVEIARGVAFEQRLVIMDEPTAPLSERDAQRVFDAIGALRRHGVSVIYITHRLKEVFLVSDRVTVLRDGVVIFTLPTSELTPYAIIRAMVGPRLADKIAAPHATFCREEEAVRTGTGLVVRRGEIVGLAGLAGSGRTELLESIFGLAPQKADLQLHGKPVTVRTPSDAIRSGIALVPDDRKAKGLVLNGSVLANIALAGGRNRLFLRRADEKSSADQWVRKLSIKVPALDEAVMHLSGGNQQKIVIAKWLYAGAQVFLLDEPMRGIDVRAKSDILDVIRDLARDGAAVLMASSEIEDLLGFADRIIVLHRGRIAGELSHGAATEEGIMHLATGAAH